MTAPAAPLGRLFPVVLVLLVVHFSTMRHVDPDLWGHVLYGLASNESGLVRVDPYSYSQDPPAPWHNHEWIAESVMAYAYAWLGPAGLILLQALLGSGAGLLGLWIIRDRCTQPLEQALLAFFLAVCLAPGIQVRPQTFTYFFFALLLFLLHLRKHKGRDWTPAIPLVIALWVNCHGGFLSGLGIYALFEAGEAAEAWLRGQRDQLAPKVVLKRGAILLCSGAATLANPYGAELYPMLQRSVMSIRHTITEWASLSFSLDYAFPILLLVLAALSWAFTRRDRHLYQLGLLLVTAFLAVRHVRHIPFLAMTAAACLPEHLQSALRRILPEPRVPATPPRAMSAALGMCIAALSFKIAGLHLDRPLGLPSEPGEYPLQAVRHMKERKLEGNLLVFFDWAQYGMWHLCPRMKVFFDGRFRTVYPPEIEEDYLEFQEAQSDRWRQALDRYPTEWVLMPLDAPVVARMAREPGWTLVYQDGLCALFGRGDSPRVRPQLGAAPLVDRGPAALEAVTWFP